MTVHVQISAVAKMSTMVDDHTTNQGSYCEVFYCEALPGSEERAGLSGCAPLTGCSSTDVSGTGLPVHTTVTHDAADTTATHCTHRSVVMS